MKISNTKKTIAVGLTLFIMTTPIVACGNDVNNNVGESGAGIRVNEAQWIEALTNTENVINGKQGTNFTVKFDAHKEKVVDGGFIPSERMSGNLMIDFDKCVFYCKDYREAADYYTWTEYQQRYVFAKDDELYTAVSDKNENFDISIVENHRSEELCDFGYWYMADAAVADPRTYFSVDLYYVPQEILSVKNELDDYIKTHEGKKLKDLYNAFTYNSDMRVYVANFAADVTGFEVIMRIALKIENQRVCQMSIVSNMASSGVISYHTNYEFLDYGTTVITIPEELEFCLNMRVKNKYILNEAVKRA